MRKQILRCSKTYGVFTLDLLKSSMFHLCSNNVTQHTERMNRINPVGAIRNHNVVVTAITRVLFNGNSQKLNKIAVSNEVSSLSLFP